MSLNKTAVFIASRFEEFGALREQLRRKIADYPVAHFAPIDLNDGRVSHRPPLAECLAHVRRSEFMILLLGDQYGTCAPGSQKSFTHLEYDEAVRDESGARVLVFCIGEHYRERRIRFAEDGSALGLWQREIDRRHTVGFFEPETPVEEIAQRILESLLAALYDLRFGQLMVDAEGQPKDLFDAIADDSTLDDSDVASLESRDFELRGLSLVDDRSRFSDTLDALLRPAAVAAYEQREEAQRAISLADYGSAIKHLKRSIEHRPLDLMSNYWLATLYVSLGRKEDCIRARELAERAARLALDDGSPYRASASYMLAARAARVNGQNDEALAYARQAVEVAPRYAKAQVELARCQVLMKEERAAMGAVRAAARLFFPSLREIFVDPSFGPIRHATRALIEEMRVQLLREARVILGAESQLAKLAGAPCFHDLSDDVGMRQVREAARKSAMRQHEMVRRLIESATTAVSQLSEDQQSGGRVLQTEIAELDSLRQNDSTVLSTRERYHRTLSGPATKLRSNWAIAAAVCVWGVTISWWAGGHSALAGFGALLGIYLLGCGYKARKTYFQKLRLSEAGITEIQDHLAGYSSRRAALARRLDELRDRADSLGEAARDGLEIFEVNTLPHTTRLLPFASPLTCKRGDIVRIQQNQLEFIAQRSGRKLEVSDGLPVWLDAMEGAQRSWTKLFRVDRVEADRLVLNRAGAYAPSPR